MAFSFKYLHERILIKKDLGITELQFIIDSCNSESLYFDELTLSLVAFEASSKTAPVAPGEGYDRGTSEYLLDLPWESWEGVME